GLKTAKARRKRQPEILQWEPQLALAARLDSAAFRKLIRRAVAQALTSTTKTPSSLSLRVIAEMIPSFYSLLPKAQRDLCHKYLAEISPENPDSDQLRSVDVITESILAAEGEGNRVRLLSSLPVHAAPADGWPTRPERWRPPLSGALVEKIID